MGREKRIHRRDMMPSTPWNLRVYGLVTAPQLHRVISYIQEAEKPADSSAYMSALTVPLFEFQWKQFLQKQKQTHGGTCWSHKDDVIAICDEKYLGGETEILQWLADVLGYRPPADDATDYNSLAQAKYTQLIQQTGHVYVYMDFSHGDQNIGRLVFELYCELLPEACKNFMYLCTGTSKEDDSGTGLTYRGTCVHRVVPGGWIQAGDTDGSHGSGGQSIYGRTFPDECLAVRHDKRGVLSLANSGRNTNQSQFFITLKPIACFDHYYVAIGAVVEGSGTLDYIERVDTLNQRPKDDIVIQNCGILDNHFL